MPHLPAELANRWYKLDENIVCPRPDGTGPDKRVYGLHSQAGAGNWGDEVEGPLGDAFRRAARAVGSPEAVCRKGEALATHQEIYAGAFDKTDAPANVVAFIRETLTADGQPLGRALPHDAALKDVVDLKQGALDRESQEQLEALKRKLRDNLDPKRGKTYRPRWEGSSASTDHLEQLCEDVYGALERVISAQIQSYRAMPPFDNERLRHREFAQRRAHEFTGQAEPLATIECCPSPSSETTVQWVVHGVSGSG